YHHVDILECRRRRTVHIAVQSRLAARVYARGVDIDSLNGTLGLDPEHVVAGGLRLARGNGELLPEDMVEQRRFADIGSAHDGDMATAADCSFCLLLNHYHSPHPRRSGPMRPQPVLQCAGWRPALASSR